MSLFHEDKTVNQYYYIDTLWHCEKACGENDLTTVIQGVGFSTMTIHLIILLCLYVILWLKTK